jgi:hypothetical protein
MSKYLVRLVAGLAVVAMPLVAVQAQDACVGAGDAGCAINTSASLTIPRLFRLSLSTDSITLATPNFATDSLDAQDVEITVAGLTVSANTDWVLNVSTAVTDFTYVGSEGGARAASLLEVEVVCASNSWSPITTGGGVDAATGVAVNNAAGSLCLRTNFPADYASTANRPGVYQLPVTITLAAP